MIKKPSFALVIIVLITFVCLGSSIQLSGQIKVNQIGYLTNESKIAYVSSSVPLKLRSWKIKRAATNVLEHRGANFSVEFFDPASEEYVYGIDFTSFTKKGEYFLEVSGVGRSYDFVVSDRVYNDVFNTLMKSFYFQRSGVDLKKAYAGKWARPAEYANDAYIYKGVKGTKIIYGEHINTAGGWRDAGDPNKKVVPACVAINQMLMLYEYFPDSIKKMELNIPSDPNMGSLSDYLTEVKVGVDWLLKMQREDGAVWHAVTQQDFYLKGMGHKDKNRRYLMPVSTTSTAGFAAVMAVAYRVFKNIDSVYAEECLRSAESAWNALNKRSIWNSPTIKGHNATMQYPESNGYSQDPPGINNTAVYTDITDSDEMYWAAAELSISTQKETYKNYFKRNIKPAMYYGSNWKNVNNFANLSYGLAYKDSTDPTAMQVKRGILNFGNLIVKQAEESGFGIPLKVDDYYWGSNGLIGQYSYSLIIAYEVTGDKRFKEKALSCLNYLLGANSLNQTFISGVGKKPVLNIFHLPSSGDGVGDVVPGLVPGGPNKYPVSEDRPHFNLLAEKSPPPAKCYIDSKDSFASNEPTIYDGAVWAFVVGYFNRD